MNDYAFIYLLCVNLLFILCQLSAVSFQLSDFQLSAFSQQSVRSLVTGLWSLMITALIQIQQITHALITDQLIS